MFFACTVILQIFGVVLFSVFSVVDGFAENIKKKHLNEKNALSDNDSIHGHRNVNDTEGSVIARPAPKLLTHRKFVNLQYTITARSQSAGGFGLLSKPDHS